MSELIVAVDAVALRAGLPVPLPTRDADVVEAAIEDAQDALVAHLGRPVTTGTYTEEGVCQRRDGVWEVKVTPVIEVLTLEADTIPGTTIPSGTFTISYRGGLDGANDPKLGPLRAYVRAHAQYSEIVQRLVRRLVPEEGRVLKSASTDGQSASWENAAPPVQNRKGMAGAIPELSSCDRWKAGRDVYQRKGSNGPWPYDRAAQGGRWGY